MAGNRWWGSLLVLSVSTGVGWGGERLWATESPNNYEPEQKALREALSQDGEGQGVASDCLGVLAVQSKVMNDIP